MSDHFYKNILYPLQDKTLALIGSEASPFYLTGGTALSRFILSHRYSDDLDFFINRQPDFHGEVDKLIDVLKSGFRSVEINNRQDSYVRVFVSDESTGALKIEFVNDVGYRVGTPTIEKSGALIDNWENILANKLTALQRLAGKDFVDTLFLSLNFNFNWESIINHSKQKDAWINEIAISEYLFNFDLVALKDVKFPSSFDETKITPDYFKILARESLHGFDNSLYGKKL